MAKVVTFGPHAAANGKHIGVCIYVDGKEVALIDLDKIPSLLVLGADVLQQNIKTFPRAVVS